MKRCTSPNTAKWWRYSCPLPAQRLTTLERLMREDRATAPAGSLKNRRPPQPGDPNAPPMQQILDELRDERL